jgi:hypothetical protein
MSKQGEAIGQVVVKRMSSKVYRPRDSTAVGEGTRRAA